MADRYWRGGSGTWNATNTTNWSATSGGAGGASVPTAADAVIINASSGSPVITVAVSTRPCLSLTTTGATCTIAGTIGITVSGNITLSTTTTWSNTGTLTINAASTCNFNGRTINSSVNFSATGLTLTLTGGLILSTTSTFTLSAGTVNLSNSTLSCGLFFSGSALPRAIQFGTGNITITGSGAACSISTNTITYTGTPTINISNNSATATTISVTSLTEISSFNFNVTVGTYNLTIATDSRFKSLNFTGFTGSWSPTTQTAIFYGNLTLVSGMTFTAGTGVWTFGNTSGTATITSAGKTLSPITQNGAGGTVALASALTITSSTTGIYTLTNGTLNLAGFTLSCGSFRSANSNTRVIQFGAGNITTTSTGTAFNVTATGLTYTGTPTVNISNNSATATTVTATSFTTTNALNFNITTGTYAFTLSASSQLRSLNFTGFTGSWSPGANGAAFYGNVTLVSGMTYTAGTGSWFFSLASGTQTITSAGKILGALTKDSVGTLTLGDALTMTSAGLAGQFTFTNGTINLGGFTLSVGAFFSVNTNTRVIQFGTSNITITGNASGSPLSVTASGLTYTGTPTVNISYSGAAALSIDTTTGNGFSATNAFDINATTGTYALTLVTGSVFKSLNFTGFTGTWDSGTSSYTLYGNLTLVSGMTYTTPTGGAYTFANTSGTATLTSAGKTLYAITESGAGGTLAFSGTTTLSNALTFTAGTLQLPASLTTTVDSFVTTGTTLKFLTSSASGTRATISDASGTNAVTYLSVKDSAAAGGATWQSLLTDNNVNAGNNTGWIFSLASGNFFLIF